MIPVGTYTNPTVIDHILGESGKKKTPRVEVLFEVVVDGVPLRSWWHGYLSDRALDRTIESLELLGWDSVAAGGNLGTLHETGILNGQRPVEIVVEDNSYTDDQGVQREGTRVAWVNDPGGRRETMDEKEAATFASKLKARVLASSAKRKAAGGKKRAVFAAASADTLDDIPF